MFLSCIYAKEPKEVRHLLSNAFIFSLSYPATSFSTMHGFLRGEKIELICPIISAIFPRVLTEVCFN